MDVSVAEWLAWLTRNCGRIGAIGSSPSNGLKPNMWDQKGFNLLCQCVYIYVCIVNPDIQTIHRCSHTSIHTHTYIHTYIHTHIYIHTSIHTYIHHSIHTYIHTHIHTHSYTHTEREMFYLTTHSTHFIYRYMASDIWLTTILIVRKETRCRHIGYSYRLTARVLLYAPSLRQDNTYHGLCYTSRGALVGTRNSSMGYTHTYINTYIHACIYRERWMDG